MDMEKSHVSEVDNYSSENHSDIERHQDHHAIDTAHGFTANQDMLPKGYYTSWKFLGTMLATGLGLAAAVGGFGLAAPNLGLINADIGPDANIVWVSLVYTLTLAVGLILVGRLSDLFGRRWFFIGSAVIALIGCVVSATATSVGALIGGSTLIGLGASGQQSFAFITGEIVPMKHRFSANAVMYLFCIPFAGLGPAVSKALILYTAAGWRWSYYIMIIVNFMSGLLFYLCYYPPTFKMKYGDRSISRQLKEFDYIGTLLFVAGFLLFILGLSWGGGVYPWKSGHVTGTMVAGGLTIIAFALYECFAKLKEPLLPIHLFKNWSWVVACILLGLGAAQYYALAIIWPSMVAVLYTDNGGASMYAGWLSCAPSIMINGGQIVSGFLAESIGKTKLQCVAVLSIGGIFLGAIAGSTMEDAKDRAIAFIVIGSFFIGWNESVCLANTGIELLDQREIGTAVGAAGSMRSAISAVASAVYLSVLANRLTIIVPARVAPAVMEAGLPVSSVPGFIAGLTTGSFTGVAGLTNSILAAGTEAYKVANSQAYATVFYTTIAFTGTAVILAFWSPNVDEKMTHDVAVTLQKEENGY